METLGCPYRPWPDLPCPLLEIILEQLPLSAYVRFSAVCRRWRSAQSSHRRRHSPSPPPMLRLPWLILSKPFQEEAFSCYSPFEDKFFTIPAPSSCFYNTPFAHGWLLSADDSGDNFNLFNLISGSKIRLPPWISWGLLNSSRAIAISPPPNYIVSVISSSTITFLRWFDSRWTQLDLPLGVKPKKKVVSCGAKHYCVCSELRWDSELYSYDLLVVDPLASPPTFQYFEMMSLSKMAEETGCRYKSTYLVAFDEEPLLVIEIVKNEECCRSRTIVGFDIFRADLGTKMWVKVESIGVNRVLMINGIWPVSLRASDIGAKGNCIYFSLGENNGKTPWKLFNLGTGRVTDLLLLNASKIVKYSQWLFVPTLC